MTHYIFKLSVKIRLIFSKLILTSILLLGISACSQENLNNDETADSSSEAPYSAGEDFNAKENENFTLRPIETFDEAPEYNFDWEQIAGPEIIFEVSLEGILSGTLPDVDSPTEFTFQLTMQSNDDVFEDTITIAILDTETILDADPIVDAGEDITIPEHLNYELTGSATDPGGTITSLKWTQLSGAFVTLQNTSQNKVTITPPDVAQNITITLQLTAVDNDNNTVSDTVKVTIENTNTSPTVNAGNNFLATERSLVNLSAIGRDADKENLTYQWQQIEPFTTNTAVNLINPNTANPSFTAPEVNNTQRLTFRVTATDPKGAKATDTVTANIININVKPEVDAGSAIITSENTSVNLTGTATDMDGNIAAINWQQIGGRPNVTIIDSNQLNATFQAPEVTKTSVLTFRLRATDSNMAFAEDTVQITINNVNKLPVVDAGENQSVNENTQVDLIGSASDPDGNISQLQWSQLTGPEVVLNQTNNTTLTFTSPEVTSNAILQFRLTAIDNEGTSVSDTIAVTVNNVNREPVVNAGENQDTQENTLVILSGSANDFDGEITSVLWTQTSGPTVTLENANTLEASFTSPEVTQTNALVFQLVATDNDAAEVRDSTVVVINNANVAPTVNTAPNLSVRESTSVILTATAEDSDGHLAEITWTQIRGDHEIAITNANQLTANFVAPDVDTTEVFAFEITVVDDDNAIAKDTIEVTIFNDNVPPTVSVNSPITTNENTTINITATANDADGFIQNIIWQQIDTNANVKILDADTSTVSITTPEVISNSTFNFRVTVTDNDGASNSATVQLVVNNVNRLPIVNAGDDQTANENSEVILNGIATDADGVIQNITWQQLSGPEVTLSNPNSINTSFVAPRVNNSETLLFELTVEDDHGAVSKDRITIVVNNVLIEPFVTAGLDETVNENTTVDLRGNASDSDGEIVSVQWSQISGPDVDIVNRDQLLAQFTTPNVSSATDIIFVISVLDNDNIRVTDEVTFTVNNVVIPPSAEAGNDQLVNENSEVSLIGTGTDTDSGNLTYKWEQLSGITVELSNSTQSTTSFTAPEINGTEVLVFRLTVTDEDGAFDSDIVNITVSNTIEQPTVDAGRDQTVNENQTVTLVGSATDPDGTIVSYDWVQISGTTTTLTNADQATASFTAPNVSSDETLSFRLTATDNDQATDVDTVNITIKNVLVAPEVHAGNDQTVDAGSEVTLTGFADDSNGEIIAVEWQQLSGTTVVLQNSNRLTTNFTVPNVTGNESLSFQLSVTDNDNTTVSDTIIINVNSVNTAPEVNAGPDQNVNSDDLVTLSGSATDIDGTITTIEWRQLSGEVTVTLSSSTTLETSFIAPATNESLELSFILSVTDENNATASDIVRIIVDNSNQPPVVDAGSDNSVEENSLVSLQAVANDSDGHITKYQWTQLAGGTRVNILNDDQANASFTSPEVNTPETLTFQITVTDNNGATSSDTVSYTVSKSNEPPTVTTDETINAAPGSTVSFTATANDSDGSIVSYQWAILFGNGITIQNANSATASVTIPAVVNTPFYILEITVTDNRGDKASATLKIQISANANIASGQFIDSEVAGLFYTTTSGYQGFTDRQGKYHYEPGDDITFTVGDIKIGTTTASKISTVFDFEYSETIAQLLQSLDEDANAENGISIPLAIHQSLLNTNLTLDYLQQQPQNADLKLQYVTGKGITVSPLQAMQHVRQSLHTLILQRYNPLLHAPKSEQALTSYLQKHWVTPMQRASTKIAKTAKLNQFNVQQLAKNTLVELQLKWQQQQTVKQAINQSPNAELAQLAKLSKIAYHDEFIHELLQWVELKQAKQANASKTAEILKINSLSKNLINWLNNQIKTHND